MKCAGLEPKLDRPREKEWTWRDKRRAGGERGYGDLHLALLTYE